MKAGVLLAACVAMASVPASDAASVFKQFVTVKGDQLVEGGKPFRFISFNIPNLHLVEDNVVFEGDSPWRWPDTFEIEDALESIRQVGGTVTRAYVLSVVRTNDAPKTPRHVLGPGKFNEDGFRALDRVLEVANRKGVRVILPFVDNWSWWGGRAEYAGFRGKGKEAFWTDPEILADFKETVRFVVNRTNTITGVPYREDKAILCWETGNEVESPAEWTREIAGYVKALDRNHPVMDGFHSTGLREISLAMPEIDIVTTHHYPGPRETFAQLILANAAKAKGRKPYVVGEFGFVPTDQMVAAMEAVRDSGASGALAWSLRVRNRDGGFYWHSEPAGGNKYKAFHWPGFPSGADYDEAALLGRMRQCAFEIRGLPAPPIAVPEPPRLLPIADPAAISWQGSVGALDYVVERAAGKYGPWFAVGDRVDESAVQYRPLFVDARVAPGRWFYRVRARNQAGVSAPSNVVGPVQSNGAVLVDEFMDLGQISEHSGTVDLQSRDCRKAKEDSHRLRGTEGAAVVYRVPGRIRAVKLDAFFPGKQPALRVLSSEDGATFTPCSLDVTVFDGGEGDYGYWLPARFEGATGGTSARWLKIVFGAEAQLSRLEIRYGYLE